MGMPRKKKDLSKDDNKLINDSEIKYKNEDEKIYMNKSEIECKNEQEKKIAILNKNNDIKNIQNNVEDEKNIKLEKTFDDYKIKYIEISEEILSLQLEIKEKDNERKIILENIRNIQK